MEKEKRKFSLSRLLTLYLRRKNKSLHCNGCRTAPAPAATPAAGSDDEPPAAPGNTWTVK